ncbi:MAG: TetR/AcrR family transcriptional regulator, partial [Vicinamibacteria bacterium]
MGAIATKADYSVGALYKYFPTKDELYLRLVESRADELLAEIRSTVIRSEGKEPKSAVLVDAVLSAFERKRKVFRLFLDATSGFQWNIRGRLGKVVYERYRGFIAFVADLIEEERPRRRPREMSAPDAALALVGVLNSFLSHGMEERPERSLLEFRQPV